MSETYTVGGDSWQLLSGFDIVAQTFTPLESHVLDYFDADLWLYSTMPPEIALSLCDASHNPVGPILAYGHAVEPLVFLPPAQRRVRFKLDSPILLEKGEIYSIWVYKDIDDVGPDNLWLFDRDDATYPRGHIIFSDDGGHTWTHFTSSDFIFCEFGDPPLPKPEPPPPIQNFALPAISYLHFPSAIRITTPSSVPCHLTCYYTDKTPLKHPLARIIRGLAVPWGTYFCFVAWQTLEQTEPGDTLYHTFLVPNWEFCQTKWFTLKGEVDNILSPSVGPIFKHHHPGITEMVIGSPAIDRPFLAGHQFIKAVRIEGANPATKAGILTQVRVYIDATVGNPIQTGIFYKTGVNRFTCRSAGAYWTPAVGYNEHDENLAVEVGDYIGVHSFQNVYLDSDHNGFAEYWYVHVTHIWIVDKLLNHVPELVISLEGTALV